MRFGLSLPDGGECGDPRFLVELAERAEAAGWDGLFLEDYVTYQGEPDEPTTNVWTALAAIALRTSRMRLATAVTPLPRRRPWNVAREATAIDQLSGGRFILGVGIGDTGESVVRDTSLTSFGEVVELRARAEMLDEGLAILDGLWRGEPFRFLGRHYRVDEVTFLPRPVQRPRIPIWVGGGYPLPGPTRRALRWDGSLLYRAPDPGTDDQRMSPADVRNLRELAGERSFDIAVGGFPRGEDLDAERAHIRAIAEAGATWWIDWVPPGDRETMRRAVDAGPLRVAATDGPHPSTDP
jgi:alkanesulfonate monooxygenase SsuD/methylene tetrahydromethanopterin reductase-like flavin-dependent oxidoreductase (luciferase family)